MQHQGFKHCGKDIDLSHLNQVSEDFNWIDKELGEQRYRFWVRYSNHCYSRSLGEGETLQKVDHIIENEPLRVFCPERYGMTNNLVPMINGLFAKPTTKVSLTHDFNWTVFQLYLSPEGGGQNRYCAFFRVKNSTIQPEDGNLHFLDMHIESAYIRTNMVETRRSCPFGHVAHMTKNNLSYF